MKIAIIGSRGLQRPYYGGIERVLAQLCPRIVARGHQVDVFGEGGDDPTSPLPHGLRNIRMPALGGKFTETISRSVLATAYAAFRSYDVINYVALGSGVLSALPRVMRKPVVVSVHGLDWAREKWPRPARRALRAAERSIIAHANEITVVSRELSSHFKTVHNRRTIYTPNGTEIRSGNADPALLAEMKLTPNNFILFASRLEPEKGAHDLIAAFSRVKTDKKLVIAGDGRYAQAYIEHLRSLACERCVFTGHLSGDYLDAVFKGAYLYVLPSSIEGLSLSLLEAMGYGKAILVSDIPENIEAIGDCGFQFQVGNVEALAAALSKLLPAEAALDAMGRRARDRARKLHSWDIVAQRYADLYEALGRRSTPDAHEASYRPKILDEDII